jgi:hypothetical protein
LAQQTGKERGAPEPYNGIDRSQGTDEYIGVTHQITNEACARYYAWDFDYDDWDEELLKRGKNPDWSSLWVLGMNVKDGFWDL